MSRSIKKDAELYEKLIPQIKRHEGEVKRNGLHVPYTDSVGVLTIGYGHNLQDAPFDYGNGLTDEQADALLSDDLAIAHADVLARYPWVERLCVARQGVIIDMAFNLGITRLSKFKNFLLEARMRDYSYAAYEMLNSRWARQVPHRAITLVKIWLTGEWR